MPPEDGEAAPPEKTRAQRPSARHAVPPAPTSIPSSSPPPPLESEEAFAATIAPTVLPPVGLAQGTTSNAPSGPASGARTNVIVGKSSPRLQEIASDATMAAPVEGSLEALPIVPESHYKTGDEIARGGMGRIVAAEDQRLHRPVALKELLEPAGDALGRFQREALITARLQHPGIVPVYEAGRWPSGEPFFAMKLVSGRPLDQVIGEARTLDARLALLPRIAAAADAIAYAHNQRVVHRDLKPGNVLIGEFGETVVIDWGLAKDLDAVESPESANRVAASLHESKPRQASVTASSTMTVAGAVMGTPAYMAPEQARGEPVDQRADVFALGAMLYHLLAGVPPYNARTATDVIAAAALGKMTPLVEREPRAPKDLVAIVNRAMAQEPPDRYPHAGELADELRRYLTGQLVAAHEYTVAQRIAKFVRKHRAAVTIASIAFVTFAVTGTFAVRRIIHERDLAERAEAKANTRRVAAEQLIDLMLVDMKDRLEGIGRLDLLANLGGNVRDYYGTLANIPGGMPPEDVDRLAVAVDLVGRAARDSARSDDAMKTWLEAREQLAQAVGTKTGPDTLFKRTMIARLEYQIGTLYLQRADVAAATKAFETAKALFGALRVEAPNDATVLQFSADNHDRIGDLLRNQSKLDGAFEEYSAAKAEREHASRQRTSRPNDLVLALSTSHLKIGSIYQSRGDTATALGEYRRCLQLRETVLEQQPDNVMVQESVLAVQEVIAELLRMTGDAKGAIEVYTEALPMMEGLVRRDPNNVAWKRQYGLLLADHGFTMLDSGDFKSGLAQLELAIATQQELRGRDASNKQWPNDLSQSYTRAGDGHVYAGEVEKGLESYGKALEIRRGLSKQHPASTPYKRGVAWALYKIGNAHAIAGALDKGIAAHEEALAIRQKLVEGAPSNAPFKNELASSEATLGQLLLARDARRGAAMIESAITRVKAIVAADPSSNEWKRTLIQSLISQGDATKGDPVRRKAVLTEALGLANTVAMASPQNIHFAIYCAEIQTGLAELAIAAGDVRAAKEAWRVVREKLEPLAKTERLPAHRKKLLERALAAGG